MKPSWRDIPFRFTTVFGLAKEPDLPVCLSSIDWWEDFEAESGYDLQEGRDCPGVYEHFIMHYNILYELIKRNNIRRVMEIGVYRSEDNSRSSTHAILTALSQSTLDTFYLGIDIDNKEFLATTYENCVTLKTSSDNQEAIRETLYDHNIHELDLLFIDGDHSITMATNDWSYSDLIRREGFVVMHDVSFHPGPKLIYECIDSHLFQKTKSEIPGDWGIAICKRK